MLGVLNDFLATGDDMMSALACWALANVTGGTTDHKQAALDCMLLLGYVPPECLSCIAGCIDTWARLFKTSRSQAVQHAAIWVYANACNFITAEQLQSFLDKCGCSPIRRAVRWFRRFDCSYYFMDFVCMCVRLRLVTIISASQQIEFSTQLRRIYANAPVVIARLAKEHLCFRNLSNVQK